MHNKKLSVQAILLLFALTVMGCKENTPAKKPGVKPPNILFAISDDQSFGHTSYGGSSFINTPAFDQIAKEGIYFTNCYAGSPGAPLRAVL